MDMQYQKIQALKYCMENADGWVVRNLRNNHNSVFPSDLITSNEDIEVWQRILSMITGQNVGIRKTDGGYICEI